ncbi:MAG: efflux transporter outer membrane subunit [Planctomycetota bacterium]
MNRPVRICVICAMLCFAGFSGCTMGPEYVRPDTAASEPGRFVNTVPGFDPNRYSDVTLWWRRFNDPVTNELVEAALVHNYNIKAAAARVMQSEALLGVARGEQWPQVRHNFSRTNERTVSDLEGGSVSHAFKTSYSQNITAGYVLDLFGQLKRGKEAAWGDLLSSEASRVAVVHSVISKVIQRRIDIATYQNQYAIAMASTQSWKNTMEIVERRYGAGLAGPVDLRLSRENLAASEAYETEVLQLLRSAELALDVLVGRRPGGSEALPGTLGELPDIEHVPSGIPAGLLDRRPDLRAKEAELAASTARVGVRIAQMYPDLTLTGTGGYSSGEFSELLDSKFLVYSLVLKSVTPIFMGGQLRAKTAQAKAVVEEKASDYAQAVLVAMSEVEDALIREGLLRKRLEAVERQVKEAGAAERLARERYSRGVEPLLTVLESERRRRNAEVVLAKTKGDMWRARVDLFLALGGDWQDDITDSGTWKEEKKRSDKG